jgi:hypothetical protein
MMKSTDIRHSKTWPRIAGGIASLALMVVLAWGTLEFKPGLGPKDYERLRSGMTRAEVERLLGGPPRNELGHRALIWIPQAGGRPISAEVAAGPPAPEFGVREERPTNARPPQPTDSFDFFPEEAARDGHQAVWIAKTTMVAVDFGPDGRLRHKYSSTVRETVPPSVMDWLASMPRMIFRSLGL